MPRWFRRLMYRLKERLQGHETLALLPELEANQYLPPDELAARQWAAARKVARFAYEHVPYYRERWAGLDLEAILSDPARWAELPILTKADIRAADRTLVAPDVPGRITVDSTTGTAHEVMRYSSDVRRAGWSAAARLRAWRWWGLDYGARIYYLRRRAWGRTQTRRARWRAALQRLGARLAGVVQADGGASQAADMRRHVGAIRRLNPEVIAGYGSLVGHLGLFLARRGERLHPPSLRLLTYTADPMQAPGQAAAQQALGAAVAGEYACRECGQIAFQCPAGNLHLTEDTLWLEVVDEAGRPMPDGQPGRVLLTDLRPSRTPYIRYAVGDMATLAPRGRICDCGVTLRQLERLDGRTSEMIPRPDGTHLHPAVMDGLCKLLPGIRHWQTRFTPPNRLRLLVEMAPEALAPWQAGLLAQVQGYAGPGFVCEVVAVESIAPHPNGKYQRLVIEEEA